MKNKEITVSNINSKNIAELIHLACHFNSEIIIENEQHRANAKSIMGIMAFDFTEGAPINLIAKGTDEQNALSAIEKFFTS